MTVTLSVCHAWGIPYAVLSRTACSHCESFSLASLSSRTAFFSFVWKEWASHPSKPCRATSALAGLAYSAAGQTASVLHTPQAVSNVPLVIPLSTGCRGKSVIGSPRAHSSACASNCCDRGQNKTHTFSKREQIYSSAYHKLPALMQPVFRAVSTSCHMGRGLAGHPRCVRVGSGYDKTRFQFAQRPPRFHGVAATAQVLRAEVMNLLVKGTIEVVRLLQPLLPRLQKRRRPATYSRSQTPESRPGKNGRSW